MTDIFYEAINLWGTLLVTSLVGVSSAILAYEDSSNLSAFNRSLHALMVALLAISISVLAMHWIVALTFSARVFGCDWGTPPAYCVPFSFFFKSSWVFGLTFRVIFIEFITAFVLLIYIAAREVWMRHHSSLPGRHLLDP